jgi:hypothetical protein
VAQDAEKQVNEACALCVQSCKQVRECTVVACRQFRKKDEEPKRKPRSSQSSDSRSAR